MANRRRTQRRAPRMSAPAGDCVIKRISADGIEVIEGNFVPKPKEARRTKIVILPNGEAIVRKTDL